MSREKEISFQTLKPDLYASIRHRLALRRVLSSGQFILGKEVRLFEKEFAKLAGTQHAVGVANGMDALEIGMKCLGIGPGDEVVTTPNTAFATILSILRTGATPVLADIDESTGLLDPQDAERVVTRRTRAFLVVHLYGQVSRIDEWERLAQRHGVYLIEDCAQAHLAKWKGRPAGSLGIFGGFSFYPTKNLGAVGDAGALVTSSEIVVERAKMMRNYGQATRYQHELIGINSRLDEIQAAFLRVSMASLERKTLRRRAVAKMFFEGISNPLIRLLAKPGEDEQHVHHLFPVLTKHRSELILYLGQRGIRTLIHYPVPAHRQAAWQAADLPIPSLTNSESFANQVVSIPCRPGLGSKEVSRIISCLNEFRIS